MRESLTIALAGNPNSGKSTLFNALTGAHQHVGNYPGITVDKKEGFLDAQGTQLRIVDLPGTYSLTAYSQEELVARNFLVNDRPRVVVDVADAGVLERNLYLTVQFMELGIPVVLALNMMDEVRKRGITIDSGRLSRLMGLPVVETVGKSGLGKADLVREALELARKDQAWKPLLISYGPDLDPVLEKMTALIEGQDFLGGRYPARWLALKYLEKDEEIISLGQAQGALSARLEQLADEVAEHCQRTLDSYPEAIIADYRYGYINSLLKQGVYVRDELKERIRVSDQIDRIVTQKFLGPLIMVGILYVIYKITFTLGKFPMDWMQAGFNLLDKFVGGAMPDGLLKSLVVSGVIDGVGGVVSFVPLILIIFFLISFLDDSGYMARMAYMLDRVLRIFGLHGCSVMPYIISGGLGGGCAVPGIMAARTVRSPKEKLATILTSTLMVCGAKLPVFIMLAAAFFPDNSATVMFLVTLLGWVAALLVSRLLRSTIIRGPSTPFVMELPPYRLPTLRGMLIHTWEKTWQYLRKAGTIILAISILIWAAMTFPSLPEEVAGQFDARKAAIEEQIAKFKPDQVQQSAKSQLAEDDEDAGTPQANSRAGDQPKVEAQDNGQAGEADQDPRLAELEEQSKAIDDQLAQAGLRYSLAGRLGTALEPISRLAGFDWRTNIALIGGFAAKEVVISTLGTAYSLGEVKSEESESLSQRIAADPDWSPLVAVSMMVFVLLYVPCLVSVVMMAREASWKWAAFSAVFDTVLAFSVAVAVFQIGTRLF
jgi:ferrous iron transport protein B